MLGIIGAMDVEVRTIKDKMTGTVTTRAAGCDFVTGELEGVMITVVQCAPGKVNAALCTQLLIDRFQVDRVINIGVACSLSERVVIKNIVIATDVCQYDIDITALGEPKGFINGLGTIKVATDPTLSDRLARTAINSGERIHRGTVASGDTFIGTAALKSAIAGVMMTLLTCYGLPEAAMANWQTDPGFGYKLHLDPALWMRANKMQVEDTAPIPMAQLEQVED